MAKSWPNRLPSNGDSLGIELVGVAKDGEKVYVNLTNEQNASLRWLVAELIETLEINRADVYPHPAVSYKNPTEAKGARW